MSDPGPAHRPPAGWYPDPADGSGQRWWNGSAWSGATRPLSPPVFTPPGPGRHASGAGRIRADLTPLGRLLSKVRVRWLAVGGAAAIVIGIALAKIPFFVHGYDTAYVAASWCGFAKQNAATLEAMGATNPGQSATCQVAGATVAFCDILYVLGGLALAMAVVLIVRVRRAKPVAS